MQKMAKACMAYEDLPIAAYRDYQLYSLLRPDGVAFHINLFPLPMPGTEANEWGEPEYRCTGFATRALYEAWCVEHRFPALNALVATYRPAVLVCVGTTRMREYLLAFASPGDFFAAAETITLPSGKRVHRYAASATRTTLLISPFLGQGGLMRDDDVAALGALARRVADASA